VDRAAVLPAVPALERAAAVRRVRGPAVLVGQVVPAPAPVARGVAVVAVVAVSAAAA
jgi:hypothetical protein